MRAYKDAHGWDDHEGIDGRNSDSRKKTFFELCRNKQNDPGFHPYSCLHLDLHEDFLVSHGLFETKHKSLPLVTPDKTKEKLATVRVKVIDKSKKIHK